MFEIHKWAFIELGPSQNYSSNPLTSSDPKVIVETSEKYFLEEF